MSDDNWTLLVEKYGHKIGCRYKNDHGEHVFFGLVYGADDYYYGMMDKEGRVHLSSCVGNLERWYEELPAPKAA